MPAPSPCSTALRPMMSRRLPSWCIVLCGSAIFVITSGGASAGDYDYVTALVQREGEVLFDRISMRPGKGHHVWPARG